MLSKPNTLCSSCISSFFSFFILARKKQSESLLKMLWVCHHLKLEWHSWQLLYRTLPAPAFKSYIIDNVCTYSGRSSKSYKLINSEKYQPNKISHSHVPRLHSLCLERCFRARRLKPGLCRKEQLFPNPRIVPLLLSPTHSRVKMDL